MGFRRFVVLALFVGMLVVPARAFAAQGDASCDSSGQNCTVIYTGDPGESNDAVVTISGSNVEVHDAATTIQPNPSSICHQGADAQTMDCPASLVVALSASLGDGNDKITVQANLPTSIGAGGGNDTMTGGPAADQLRGGDGSDTINGGDGADTVYGDNPDGSGTGNDTLDPGNGNDTVYGGDGNDTYVAEAGLDGTDTFSGGPGNDTASWAARTQPLQLSLDGAANDGLLGNASDNMEPDVENLVGGSAGDQLSGSDQSNMLDGGSGDDTLAGGAGDDQLVGDDGSDTFDGGTGSDTELGGTGNDTLAGGDGTDTLDGGDGTDHEDGGAGDDNLSGGAAGDALGGGAGNDSLSGGAGDDTLDGGAGADALGGGDGTDLADYGARAAGVTVTLDGNAGDGEPGEGDNVATDVEDVKGGAGPDTLTGDAGSNRLDGGAGENYEDGGGGADTLIGGTAGDVFRSRNSTQPTTITCDGGPDFVIAKPSDTVSPDCAHVDRGVSQKPKLRSSVVVTPAAGTLGMSPAGIVRDVPLLDTVVLPLRSVVDTATGVVRVTSSQSARRAQTATVYAGAFAISQTRGKLPVTQLALQDGDFGACTAGRAARAAAAGGGKAVRRLWASGKGRFRTQGRYAAAAVRGTKWLTEDRCDGTLVRVVKGAVSVTDLVKHKTVVVKAGRTYLARAPRH